MRTKYANIFRILAIAVILSLAIILIPASPVLAAPMITLSPTSGSPGTMVTVTGANFESYRGDAVFILYDGVEIDHIIVSDDGSFVTSFNIPQDALPGTAYVAIEDEEGNQVGRSRAFTVWEAEIELYPKDGIVGTMVTIEGRGFYVGEEITFSYNGTRANLDTGEITPTGEFTHSFNIPNSIAGNHKIEIEDVTGNSDRANFNVISSITLNPSSGAMGDRVTVGGTGFGRESEVTIYFDKTEVGASSTDKYGSFEATFDVHITMPGTYNVVVGDEEGNIARSEFTIAADINLSPTVGNVSTAVTVSGTGFEPGRTVTINYDEVQVATDTGGNGAFSITFDVPVSIGGIHTITASDGTNTVKRIFTMESEAPPIPGLLLPEEASRTEAETRFDWEDVDDPSGVTYILQVANDEDFTSASMVLEEKDLTDSAYTITEGKKLEPRENEAPYYWRVKTIDGAFNESQWSAPGSFYIGSSFAMPRGAIYALIAIGVGFFAFWLGRRTAYSRREQV